jgi:hypothetical protein
MEFTKLFMEEMARQYEKEITESERVRMYIDVRPLIEFKHSIEDMIEDVVYIYED